jgi:hypothetical protein
MTLWDFVWFLLQGLCPRVVTRGQKELDHARYESPDDVSQLV